MKKVGILTIIFLQSIFLFAQNQGIFKIWGNSLIEEHVSDIFEVNNNIFFVSTTRELISSITYRESIILKIDSNCNVTDSFKLRKYLNRGKYYHVSSFLYYNNRIIGLGRAIDNLSEKCLIRLAEFDQKLTIIYDTLLGDQDSLKNLYTFHMLLTSQNKLLITLGFVPYIHDTVNNIQDTTNTIVWLLDSNFNIIKERPIFNHFWFDGFSVVEMKANHSYHIVAQYGITQIKQSDLSVDSIVWAPYYVFLGGPGAKTINDSTYIHPTRSHFHDINYKSGSNTCLFIRNNNGKTKDSIFIGNMLQSYDMTSVDNVAFSTTDSIFVTGTNYSLDSNSFLNY